MGGLSDARNDREDTAPYRTRGVASRIYHGSHALNIASNDSSSVNRCSKPISIRDSEGKPLLLNSSPESAKGTVSSAGERRMVMFGFTFVAVALVGAVMLPTANNQSGTPES